MLTYINMSYYAVHTGKKPGIYNTWDECKLNVNGYKGAKYKKFKNKDDAEKFIKNGKIENNLTEHNNLNQNDDEIFVYTDGSCSNNGSDDCKAGIGVYFGENDIRNISSTFEGKQTNNTAELKAILEAYNIIQDELKIGKKIFIYCDSTYAIKCCTTYGQKMEKEGWNKDIPNKELVKDIYQKCSKYKNLEFKYIKAHTDNNDIHSIGNKMADKLAKKASS